MSHTNDRGELYGVALTIRPTGALTFRRLPSAILHISTYPFMPPTAMSGWLRRLFMLAKGHYPNTSVNDPAYYVMPKDYHVLGAYPQPEKSHASKRRCEVHVTKRHGVRGFNHNAFSRLTGSRTKHEVYQLHTWEYLFAEQLIGIVLHREASALEPLASLINFGSKCGKEGFAYLESVSSVRCFRQTSQAGLPTVPATGEELLGAPADLFLAYRHEHGEQEAFDPKTLKPSRVSGFAPTWMGWPSDEAILDYLTDGEYLVPKGIIEVF